MWWSTNINKWLFALILLFSGVFAYGQDLANTQVQTPAGEQSSLSKYLVGKAVVLVFRSNSCPFDAYYWERIKNINKSYASRGVKVVMINSFSSDSRENKDAMKKWIEGHPSEIVYLKDVGQSVMKSLDAHKTPEVFLVRIDGGKYQVIYRGAIDDNAQVATDVSEPYLRNAIEAFLVNQPIEPSSTHIFGCNIN